MPSLLKPNSHQFRQLVRQLPCTRETIVGAVWLATVKGRVEKGGPRRPQLVGIRNMVQRGTRVPFSEPEAIVRVTDGYVQ